MINQYEIDQSLAETLKMYSKLLDESDPSGATSTRRVSELYRDINRNDNLGKISVGVSPAGALWSVTSLANAERMIVQLQKAWARHAEKQRVAAAGRAHQGRLNAQHASQTKTSVKQTGYKNLGYWSPKNGMWRFVDLTDSDSPHGHEIGRVYATRKELLEDLEDFAAVRGFPKSTTTTASTKKVVRVGSRVFKV